MSEYKYKNGREAKVNDRVFFQDRQNRLHLGKVTAIEPLVKNGEPTLRISPLVDAQPMPAAECIHAEDYNAGKPAEASATASEPKASDEKN